MATFAASHPLVARKEPTADAVCFLNDHSAALGVGANTDPFGRGGRILVLRVPFDGENLSVWILRLQFTFVKRLGTEEESGPEGEADSQASPGSCTFFN